MAVTESKKSRSHL